MAWHHIMTWPTKRWGIASNKLMPPEEFFTILNSFNLGDWTNKSMVSIRQATWMSALQSQTSLWLHQEQAYRDKQVDNWTANKSAYKWIDGPVAYYIYVSLQWKQYCAFKKGERRFEWRLQSRAVVRVRPWWCMLSKAFCCIVLFIV